LFFAVTTPIGIGIGIGLQSSAYDPESVTSLLVSGILDSLSIYGTYAIGYLQEHFHIFDRRSLKNE